MDTTGHLQLMAERDVNGVFASSPQVAFTTKGSRVASEMSQPSPPHPVVAPQLNGSRRGKPKILFVNQKNFNCFLTVRRRDERGAEAILLEGGDDRPENSGVEVSQSV